MIYYKDKLKTLGTSLTSLSFILMFGLLTILSIEKPESFYFGLITIFFIGRLIVKLLLPQENGSKSQTMLLFFTHATKLKQSTLQM